MRSGSIVSRGRCPPVIAISENRSAVLQLLSARADLRSRELSLKPARRTQLCHAADEVRVTAQAAADAAREAAAAAARYESLRREYERRGGLPVWGGAGGSGSAAGGSSKGGDGARGVPGSDGDALPPRLFDWAGEQGGKGGAQPQGSEARVSLEASAPEWDENRLVEGEGTGDGAVDGVRVVEGRPVGRMANSDLPDLPDVGQLSAPGKSIDPDELPTSFGVRHDKGKGVEGDAGGEEDADEKLDDLMLRFARLKSRDRD